MLGRSAGVTWGRHWSDRGSGALRAAWQNGWPRVPRGRREDWPGWEWGCRARRRQRWMASRGGRAVRRSGVSVRRGELECGVWSVECGVVRRGERASEKGKPPTLVGLWSSVGYQGGAPISPSERPNDVCYTAPQATAVRREGTKRVGRSVGRSSRRQSQCQPVNHERWKRTVCSDLQSRGGSRWRRCWIPGGVKGGRCSSLVKAQWEVTRSCHRRVTCGSRSSLFTEYGVQYP